MFIDKGSKAFWLGLICSQSLRPQWWFFNLKPHTTDQFVFKNMKLILDKFINIPS